MTDSGAEHLRVELSEPVASITLSRPEKLNALAPKTLRELAAAAREVDRRHGVRAVVIRGAGRAFCAGYDLDSFGRRQEDPADDDPQLGREMADAVSGMQAVTVAAIHGHCVGGGVVLAAACDLRIAAQDARFVIPEVDLGIPLTWTAIPRLVRELGPAITREIVLTCRPFTADEAYGWRWVNRVVAADDLGEVAVGLAEEIAGKAALAVSFTIGQVRAAEEEMVSTRQGEHEARLLAAALRDPGARAAAERYLDGRRA